MLSRPLPRTTILATTALVLCIARNSRAHETTAPVLDHRVEPAYPQEARATGKTGMVVLKIVILADGTVANVQVLRGDEPFVTAALDTVKRWKYEPARFKGQAISVYRIIQIPFKLTA